MPRPHYPGLDNLHAVVINNERLYAHADGLGNVIALTDETQGVRRVYAYDDWGNDAGTSGTLSAPNADRARWKGALWMGPELDLYYMRNRWYEPGTGRFLSEDPIGLTGGINPVVFASSDGVNGRDPVGLASMRLTECERFCGAHTPDGFLDPTPTLAGTEPVGSGSGGGSGKAGSIGPRDVFFACRSVQNLLGLFGHCAIRVKSDVLGIDIVIELSPRGGKNVIWWSPVGSSMGKAFGRWTEVTAPSQMTRTSFDLMVLQNAGIATSRVTGTDYWAAQSNDFAGGIIRASGAQIPGGVSDGFLFGTPCLGGGCRR